MQRSSSTGSRKRERTTSSSSEKNPKEQENESTEESNDGENASNNNNNGVKNRKKLVTSRSNNKKAQEKAQPENGKEEEHQEETAVDKNEIGKSPARPARVYVDGIFDLFHFGHALALRQAKSLFPHTHLLVGVCNDELTHKLKGLTVMTHAERAESLRHCRYVDEVVENAPWVVDQEFMDVHKIDFIAHGQDPVLDKDGNDIYQFAKDSGKFLYINRTDGISTSDLILRIIKEYDSYVARNIARGYSRKDLNVGLIKEKQIVMKQKLKKLKEDIKEGMEENDLYGFIRKFGGYLKQGWEGDKFPC